MKVAAYQAPLLNSRPIDALVLMRRPVEQCQVGGWPTARPWALLELSRFERFGAQLPWRKPVDG